MKITVQKKIEIEKCDKCNKYGRLVKLNYPDNPNSGTYMPYCDCEYGKWLNNHDERGDMFFSNRHFIR